MQVQRVQNNNTYKPTFSSQLSLRGEIAKLKNPTREMVQDIYGTFGLDIFEGKEHLTILSDKELKKSKNLISKIKTWFTGISLYDYEEGDSLRKVVLKYAGNKESGLVKDVETKFGKKGLAELDKLYLQGYVSL